MMNIKCLKLVSGEELIGTFVEQSATHVTLSDVSAVMMMPTQTPGQISLGLMPFLPYSEQNKFEIARDKIVVMFEPNIDMINNYNRKYGSGIQVVNSLKM